jgi:hypothetical protein
MRSERYRSQGKVAKSAAVSRTFHYRAGPSRRAENAAAEAQGEAEEMGSLPAP